MDKMKEASDYQETESPELADKDASSLSELYARLQELHAKMDLLLEQSK